MNMTHDRLHVVCGLCNNVDVHVMCKHPSFVQLWHSHSSVAEFDKVCTQTRKTKLTFTFLRKGTLYWLHDCRVGRSLYIHNSWKKQLYTYLAIQCNSLCSVFLCLYYKLNYTRRKPQDVSLKCVIMRFITHLCFCAELTNILVQYPD